MKPTLNVQVRYFASIRERLGSGESIEMFEGSSVATLRDALIARGGDHAEMLARGRALRCALDQVLCDETALLHDSAEVAFFPPVTGG